MQTQTLQNLKLALDLAKRDGDLLAVADLLAAHRDALAAAVLADDVWGQEAALAVADLLASIGGRYKRAQEGAVLARLKAANGGQGRFFRVVLKAGRTATSWKSVAQDLAAHVSPTVFKAAQEAHTSPPTDKPALEAVA